MSIYSYMDASTGYVTEKDMGLVTHPHAPVIAYEYEEGCFIRCSEIDREELKECGFSEEFINLMEFASKEGCTFLRLDRDGDASYDFPWSEW